MVSEEIKKSGEEQKAWLENEIAAALERSKGYKPTMMQKLKDVAKGCATTFMMAIDPAGFVVDNYRDIHSKSKTIGGYGYKNSWLFAGDYAREPSTDAYIPADVLGLYTGALVDLLSFGTMPLATALIDSIYNSARLGKKCLAKESRLEKTVAGG